MLNCPLLLPLTATIPPTGNTPSYQNFSTDSAKDIIAKLQVLFVLSIVHILSGANYPILTSPPGRRGDSGEEEEVRLSW